MSYIEFDDVKKIYKMGDVKIKALNGASFTIDKGEFAVIAGASGAGKSTILNLMGGMDTATTGKIIVDKELGFRNNAQSRDIITFVVHDL